MTLDERIEAAARAVDPAVWDQMDEEERTAQYAEVARVFAAAFPELFTSPPTMWLAPMEISDDMRKVMPMVFAQEPANMWRAARDAHLNREGK